MNPQKTNRKIWLGVAFAVALLLLTSARTAVAQQWTGPDASNNISNANTGNVGVGTTTPTYKFDVLSTTNILARFGSTAAANNKLLINAPSGYNSNLTLQHAGIDKWYLGNRAANDRFSFVGSTGGIEVFSILQNGNVGIGTTNPITPFHTKATGSWSTHTDPRGIGVHTGALFDFLYTDTSVTYAGLTTSEATVDLASNPSGIKGVANLTVTAVVPTTNSAALTNLTIRGVDSRASFQGTGSLNQLHGLFTISDNSNTGTITNLQGLVSQVRNNNAAGVVTSVVGVDTWMPSNAGTVTNYFGARVNSLGNTGTVTNTYGVYVGDISSTGTHTNKPFSFYAWDANTYNYFAGNVGIGTVSPAGILDVERTANDGGVILRLGNGNAAAVYDIARNSSTGNLSIQGNQVGYNNILLAPTSGNVGIGTVTPTYKLDVVGEIRSSVGFRFGDGTILTTAGLNANNLTSGTVPDARFPATLPAASGANLTSLNANYLGSGTLPDARFPATLPAVSGASLTSLNANNLTSGTLLAARMPALTGDLTTTTGGVATTLANTGVTAGSYTNASVTVDSKGRITAASSGTGSTAFGSVTAGTNAVPLVIGSGGSLGVSGSGTINATTLGGASFAAPGAIGGTTPGSGAFSAVGINTAPSSYKLDVNGNTNVSGNITVGGTGNITAAGTIEGGNIKAKYQDVAEWVPASEQIPTGTVVVLDANKSNHVVASDRAYDTRVAGVISAQPGITLGEGGEGKVLVATTGRVLVKVDATNGAIHIGDLLVTSDVPGVAMKSEPIKVGGRLMHMPGTLIGKALEPLEKGSGKILVLLSLQ